jgi:hypothetical protein
MQRATEDENEAVGRPPWSSADALVGLCELAQEAGQGAGCRPGGPPHQTAATRFAAIFETSPDAADTSVRATEALGALVN